MHMQMAGDWKWEIAVPNGMYTVRIVAGDPTATNSNYRINVQACWSLAASRPALIRGWREPAPFP
jgi:hypothetical protein